jgi:hypothetical protein
VFSWTTSKSESSKSWSVSGSLAVCTETSSSEVYPASPQLLLMLSCMRRERAPMAETGRNKEQEQSQVTEVEVRSWLTVEC